MKSFKEFLNERVTTIKPTEAPDGNELISACYNGDYITARKLLDEGTNPDFRDADNRTPLGIASRYPEKEYYKLAEILLEAGANPDLGSGATDSTPLMLACNLESNKLNFVALLFKYGANPNKQNKSGWTPLSIVARDNAKELFDIFKEHRADAFIKDNVGSYPMDIAKRYNRKEFINYFSEK